MSWSEIWKSIEDTRVSGETYRWLFYRRLLGNYDFRDKRVLEIGCGTGINSVFMARAGAHVTFLDCSQEALDIAERLLKESGVRGELVCENAFHHSFSDEFDLVHSEGVIEHFKGEYRQGIVGAHAKATKQGGKVLIIVPNLKCPPYRIGKFLAEKTGTWIYGNEYPYSRKELEFRMRKSGLDVQKIQGAEVAFSPGWLFSPFWQKSPGALKRSLGARANRTVANLNYGPRFLNGWGVVLGTVGKRG